MMQRQRLLENALPVMKNAHAPYSGYKIGCAVMGESGKIYVGCNIENVSYGATICAEQVAMGTAIAGSEKGFMAMAIVSSGEAMPYPCGIVRQFIKEFCNDLVIFVSNNTGEVVTTNISELYPDSFDMKPKQ